MKTISLLLFTALLVGGGHAGPVAAGAGTSPPGPGLRDLARRVLHAARERADPELGRDLELLHKVGFFEDFVIRRMPALVGLPEPKAFEFLLNVQADCCYGEPAWDAFARVAERGFLPVIYDLAYEEIPRFTRRDRVRAELLDEIDRRAGVAIEEALAEQGRGHQGLTWLQRTHLPVERDDAGFFVPVFVRVDVARVTTTTRVRTRFNPHSEVYEKVRETETSHSRDEETSTVDVRIDPAEAALLGVPGAAGAASSPRP